MAIPWLRILDAAIGVSDVARRVRGGARAGAVSPEEQLARAPGGALGHLETRLAGVVVAALKEAFDRDSRRLELERQQLEAERQRAERAFRLEMMRQAADREVGRLRLLAGVAVVSWIGTLFFAARLVGAGLAAKVTLGGGWVLLLASLALSFVAQSRVQERMARADDYTTPIAIDSGPPGSLAPWFIVAGLALVGFAVLLV
jgi:hypothetical protein